MPTPENLDIVTFSNLALTWIGFGTIVGLAAKAIMPGRDPGGAIATVLMGIVGTLIGCAVLKYLYPAEMIAPISLKGFSVGTAGAFVLLVFYKILGGYWFTEGEEPGVRLVRRRRRRRRYQTAVIDE
jgi:uncharacterized membrane protein YeaQ/YmgE (transglycosylase-associated protein family)